jgi:Fe2+ or Zn2+ uptake regulation protein
VTSSPSHHHTDGAPRSAASLHTSVRSRLSRDGQRYTASRTALVEALHDAPGPLPLPELLERCPGIPQSSAYRNLADLERAGVVHRIASSDEFGRFELAEDLTGHHHHLICDSCGSVADFTVPPTVERNLDAALLEAAAAAGFRPDRHRLDLLGRCAACAGDST